ncbi:MAG: hypothetical protein NZ473_08755, partial [Candidatus Kapabacteria bacterium]|nr:hypothetical protein [Candidatus Kapabacteria bacterium]
LLPMLGPSGSVVRSVRISAETVRSSAELPLQRSEAQGGKGAEPRQASTRRNVPDPESLPMISPAPLKPVQWRSEPPKPLPPQ